MDPVPVATRPEDPAVDQPLELIRNGLRAHLYGSGEIGDAQFVFPNQDMQQAHPRCVAENLENRLQVHGL
jgi:hypothetical protein